MLNEIYLLDTHIWVWLINGDQRLNQAALLQKIESASKESRLRLSMISIWEVGMLAKKNRIRFAVDVYKWVESALNLPGLSVCPLTPSIALNSSDLPGEVHGDPADRIIIATARNIGAQLITADQQIIEYSRSGNLKTLAV